MARVVFLGTPQAAVPTLELLDEVHDVALVVTQPDRAKGRSKRLRATPVKEAAVRLGLTVRQPGSRPELRTAIEEHGPFDVGVVVAYGRILRPEILEAPTHGVINVHFSLLPRWRGAAPVARALMAGDATTGVTIMKLDEGLDTGPILTTHAIAIPEDVDSGRLTEMLSKLGAELLVDSLDPYLTGALAPVPQNEERATYAGKIEKSDRAIDPEMDARSVVALIRGLAPAPAATLEIDGRTHKILEARVVDTVVDAGTWANIDGRLVAGVGGGAVELLRLQPPGKTVQPGGAWLNGVRRDVGVVA